MCNPIQALLTTSQTKISYPLLQWKNLGLKQVTHSKPLVGQWSIINQRIFWILSVAKQNYEDLLVWLQNVPPLFIEPPSKQGAYQEIAWV